MFWLLALGLGGLRCASARRLSSASEPQYCTYGALDGFHGEVRVFVTSQNTRSLMFGPPFAGVETEVTCKGEAPKECLAGLAQKNASGGAPDCATLRCDCDLDTSGMPPWAYMVEMVREAQPICEKGRAFGKPSGSGGSKLLMIGLGGGAVPRHVLSHCPSGTSVESVEYDPRIIQAAVQFFGYHLSEGVSDAEQGDALEVVQERAQQKRQYNGVMIDCYGSDTTIPEHCSNAAFVGGLRKILASGGKAIQSVWKPQLSALMGEYQTAFGSDRVHSRDVDGQGGNFLVIAEVP